ncbi:hypothetical protein F5B21DRAFT_379555 [Xylaria acuta]|nr:hypothetical protein F5B21DRAFT_379555 [Xylaria acuta]
MALPLLLLHYLAPRLPAHKPIITTLPNDRDASSVGQLGRDGVNRAFQSAQVAIKYHLCAQPAPSKWTSLWNAIDI